jgi:hypothetical protein
VSTKLEIEDADIWYFALTNELSYSFSDSVSIHSVTPGTSINLAYSETTDLVTCGRLLEWVQSITHELVISGTSGFTFEEAISVARHFAASVRIYSLAYPIIPFAAPVSWADIERSHTEDFGIAMLQYMPFERIAYLPFVFEVDTMQLDLVKISVPKMGRMFESPELQTRQVIELAVECLNSYLFETSIEMRILKLHIGIEALYGFERGAKNISEWISKYLYNSRADRESKRDEICRFLEMRNDIAHSRRHRKSDELLTTADLELCLFEFRRILSMTLARAILEECLPTKARALDKWPTNTAYR